MPNQDNKFIKYYYGEKSIKVPGIIYADLECLSEKMHSCQNNLEKSYTEKKTKHTPSGYYCLQIVHLMQQKANLIVSVTIVSVTGKTMEKFSKDKSAYNGNN